MSETVGTVTLHKYSQDNRKYLKAIFEPPVPRTQQIRKPGDSHPVHAREHDEAGNTVAMIYERDMFGWAEAEREEAFAAHWQKRASKIGYELLDPMVRVAGQPTANEQVAHERSRV